jgi:hypothetical protein
MPRKDLLREATRRRSITEREVLDVIAGRINAWKAERRECQRFSAGWGRADAAIDALELLKRDIRAAISRGRKP